MSDLSDASPNHPADLPAFEEDDRPLSERMADPNSLFVLNLGGFEGPIDLLLVLARDQKVDLMHIPILDLADQYLKFVETGWVHARSKKQIPARLFLATTWRMHLSRSGRIYG